MTTKRAPRDSAQDPRLRRVLKLHEQPLKDWRPEDPLNPETIRRLLAPLSNAALWFTVWQFPYPLPTTVKAHAAFMRWWHHLRRALDRGHWMVIFEPGPTELMLYVFTGLRPAQDPLHAVVSVIGHTGAIPFSVEDYDYRRGVAWFLKDLQHPSAFTLGPTLRLTTESIQGKSWGRRPTPKSASKPKAPATQGLRRG